MTVLVLPGPPGAGKTTAAAALAAGSERAVHLEADRFFHFIRAGYVEPWRPESHAQNEVVMGIVARAAAGYADAGYLTVVDGIVIPRWFLAPLRDGLREAGHDVAYAVLRAPLELCLERAHDRPAEREVLVRLWHSFADLGPLERHALDTSALTPEQTADVLRRRLDELTLA